MPKERVETTLFSIISVDGKITTGDLDILDFEKDFPRIRGIKEGYPQYDVLLTKTDLNQITTGRVMAKIGVNTRKDEPEKIEFSFVIIDRKPHLDENGVRYLAKWANTLYLVTNNKRHPAFTLMNIQNLKIIYYPTEIDLEDLLVKLKSDHKIETVTLCTGGTLTSVFLRKKLIDHISVVVAPALIGGMDTSTLIDGESLHYEKDLIDVKALELKKCEVLKDSYLHLFYDVINETEIESYKYQ